MKPVTPKSDVCASALRGLSPTECGDLGERDRCELEHGLKSGRQKRHLGASGRRVNIKSLRPAWAYSKIPSQNKINELNSKSRVMVAHTFNSSSQEAKVGGV